MGEINNILKDVNLVKVMKIKQHFNNERILDTKYDLINKLIEKSIDKKIYKGMRIAITGGSRGISNYKVLLKSVVDFVISKGGIPFIVPAMGSHGGGSSKGQSKILEKLGITIESIGCEIISSMDVIEIGKTCKGLPVYIDKNAYCADGIILLNRIKPHTSFRGEYESGLVKMLAIGLGKRKGADITHSLRFENMAENILESAKVSIEKLNILCGVCTIENAYDEIYNLSVLNKEEILKEEPKLLDIAKNMMPQIYLDEIDILIVKEIGKNISGTGMDTNIIGRYHTDAAYGGPKIIKIGLLDINQSSMGNANGMGLADYTTKKFYDKIDFESTYLNAITSTEPNSIKLPMVLDSDELVIKACAKTCGKIKTKDIRLVIIENTKMLNNIYMSRAAYENSRYKDKLEVLSEEFEIEFDENGNMKI